MKTKLLMKLALTIATVLTASESFADVIRHRDGSVEVDWVGIEVAGEVLPFCTYGTPALPSDRELKQSLEHKAGLCARFSQGKQMKLIRFTEGGSELFKRRCAYLDRNGEISTVWAAKLARNFVCK